MMMMMEFIIHLVGYRWMDQMDGCIVGIPNLLVTMLLNDVSCSRLVTQPTHQGEFTWLHQPKSVLGNIDQESDHPQVQPTMLPNHIA